MRPAPPRRTLPPMIHVIEIDTDGPGLLDVSDRLAALIPAGDGLATLLVRHTSCSLLIQENADPDVRRDLSEWAARAVPRADDPSMRWLRHTAEGPDDMPAHIRAAILPVSLSIPFRDGRLMLGRWQGVYLWEHRDRPRRRQVAVHLGP